MARIQAASDLRLVGKTDEEARQIAKMDAAAARIAALEARIERLRAVVQRLIDGWGDPRCLCRWADTNVLSDRAEVMALAAYWAVLEDGDMEDSDERNG